MLTKQILKPLPFSHASSITEAACSISFDCNHVLSTDHTSNIVHKHAMFTMPFSLAYLICRETLLLSHYSFFFNGMLYVHPMGFETMTLPPSIHKGEGNAFFRNSTICCCLQHRTTRRTRFKI